MKEEKLAMLTKNGILVSIAEHYSSFWRTKNLYCFSKPFFGLLKAKNILQRPSGQKKTRLRQKEFFVLPHHSHVGAYLLNRYFTIFLKFLARNQLRKDNFTVNSHRICTFSENWDLQKHEPIFPEVLITRIVWWHMRCTKSL